MVKNAKIKKPKNKKNKLLKKHKKFGKPSTQKSFDILNRQPQMRMYKFKEVQAINDVVGTGNSTAGVYSLQPSTLGRWASISQFFNQYRIDYIRLRFRLNNIELTDNAIIPTLYVRYLYDPGLVSGNLNETSVMRFSNVVRQALQNGAGMQGQQLTYNVKPAILALAQNYGATSVNTYPQFKKWCDVSTSSHLAWYGYFYFIDNLPTGMSVSIDQEIGYSFRDTI